MRFFVIIIFIIFLGECSGFGVAEAGERIDIGLSVDGYLDLLGTYADFVPAALASFSSNFSRIYCLPSTIILANCLN